MTPNSAAKPSRSPRSNPNALDCLFILFASVTLLLLFLWIVTSLQGRQPLFADLPQWLKDALSSVWTKVILGSGTAGTLALRKWLFQGHPSPNYLLWIPGFTALLIAALFVVAKLVESITPPTPTSANYHAPIRFTLESRQNSATPTTTDKEILLTAISPKQKNMIGLFPSKPDQQNTYDHEADIPRSEEANFTAEINHKSLISNDVERLHWYEYRICVKANPGKHFPATPANASSDAIVRLACTKNGNCPRAPDDPGYVLACDEASHSGSNLIPAVYADEPAQTNQQIPQRGWVVPSLKTLDGMTDRQRVGYTRFNVSFTPDGKVAAADQYYFILRVNDQPIYIDGFLPDRTIYPLQHKATNEVKFALENLNFTGRYEGYEKLRLTIVFLKGTEEVYRQELQRDYIALRPAPAVTTDSAIGTFRWSGEYVAPKNENKYEILLASAQCGDHVQKECVARAMNAKSHFDRNNFKFNDKPIVMVVRPPLRTRPSYALALGVVQPTSQVQFTFNAEEAAQLCHWAGRQIGKGKGGGIQKDLRRYEVATRDYKICN